MNKKRILAVIALILLGAIAVTYGLVSHIHMREPDPAAINDVVKTLEENWPDSLDSAASKAAQYGIAMVVLDDEGKVRSTTGGAGRESIHEALKQGDQMIMIQAQGKSVGTAIIQNDEAERLEELRIRYWWASLGFLALLLTLFAGYAFVLNRRIVRPFRKLKGFAASVAAGQLDMPLDMDRNNLFGAFTESFDIMREELHQARERERLANRSKKELVASLSHDINTPVASIKALSELLQVKVTDDRVRSQLAAIGEKADQIELLVRNLFTATLEELSELKVQVMEEESTILYELIRGADHKGRVKPFVIAECIICCDRLRLQQVLDNVINNSYKYADTDMEVHSEITDGMLAVRIRDYGQGVPEDELPLLFQKFYRGRNAGGQTGSGLGLYNSRYFMEKMGGGLAARSLPSGLEIELRLALTS